jgi:hypothetical protein
MWLYKRWGKVKKAPQDTLNLILQPYVLTAHKYFKTNFINEKGHNICNIR